jgi:hypothetical protein
MRCLLFPTWRGHNNGFVGQFLAADRNIPRCLDPEADTLTFNRHHCDNNVVANMDAFAEFSSENQH